MWLTSDAKKLLDKPWWSPFCPLEPPEWFSLSSGIWQHSLHLRVMVTALFSRWAQSLLITDLHMAWSLVLSSAWPPSCEGPFILIINNHHLSNTWYYVPHNAKTLAFQFHIIIIYHKILSCFWFVSQPFTNVKTILSSQAVQIQEVGWTGPMALRLLMDGQELLFISVCPSCFCYYLESFQNFFKPWTEWFVMIFGGI